MNQLDAACNDGEEKGNRGIRRKQDELPVWGNPGRSSDRGSFGSGSQEALCHRAETHLHCSGRKVRGQRGQMIRGLQESFGE